jgi:hypothetical protein
MNNSGTIVGYYSETTRTVHGFIRSPDGTFTTFDVPNAATGGTQITAINDLGDFAGSYADQSGNSFGFVRTNNNQVTLLTYVMFSQSISPTSISPTSLNDGGSVVGYFLSLPSQCINGFEGAFPALYPQEMGGFSSINCSNTRPTQISADGSIIGSFSDQNGQALGFLSPAPPASIVTLTISPMVGALPASINASGTIVGSADTHSFLRTSDSTYTTFDPPGAAKSWAVSINASGIMVGNFVDNGSISHAYLRNSDGRLVILDAPGAGQSPVSGTYVVAINDSGTITGYYTDSNGFRHGFVRK